MLRRASLTLAASSLGLLAALPQSGGTITKEKNQVWGDASVGVGICPASVQDQAGSGCVELSTVPTLGSIYPLGPEFSVSPLGRIGINTTSPSWPIHAVASQAACRLDTTSSVNGSALELRSQVTSPAFIGAINFVDQFGSYQGQIAYEGSNQLTMRVNGSERLRIDAAGKILPRGRIEQIQSTGGTYGAWFENTSTLSASDGVNGIARAPGAIGVAGRSLSTSPVGLPIGVYGVNASTIGFGVFSSGAFGGTGAKYFIQPHPLDPGQEVRFVCLEGNESGTYFRGSSALQGGRAVIRVPEEFRLVSEAGGLTVQVTPGGPGRIWVAAKDLSSITVEGDADVPFDYFVNGVRRGFADHDPLHENRSFVPEVRGLPFGTQYPDALRDVLVENGTLQPDYTPNEATALRMGWELRDPTPEELEAQLSGQ